MYEIDSKDKVIKTYSKRKKTVSKFIDKTKAIKWFKRNLPQKLSIKWLRIPAFSNYE